MDIKVTKRDVIWAYLAQFFNLGSGLIILPLILHKLSSDEVGYYYIMLAVGSIAALFDLGFVTQFSRSVTYVLSGSRELKPIGLETNNVGDVDYHLLKNVIDTAKYVYKRLSIIILFGLLSLGSLYVWHATDGFVLVSNSLLIWVLYCVSVFFNVYFKYLDSLLNGASLIAESKIATVYSKLVYLVISFVLLIIGFGLISVVVANIISPFIGRFYSYSRFFNDNIKKKLLPHSSTKEEINRTFRTIWVTTSKLALNMFGSFASNQAGLFFCGLFLSLSEVGSFGLMTQLFTILSGLSMNIIMSYQPQICNYRIQGNDYLIKKDLSFGITISFLIKFVGSICIIFLAPIALNLIGSNSVLPSCLVMIVYAFQLIQHDNLACFCMYITSGNEVPFVKPSLITAIITIIATPLFLYSGMGILGAILGVLIPEMCYNSWKWPLYVLKGFNMSATDFYLNGFNEINSRVVVPSVNSFFLKKMKV